MTFPYNTFKKTLFHTQVPVYISPSKRFIEDLLRSRPAQGIRRGSSFSIVRTTTINSLILFSVIRRHSRVFWTCAIRSFISLHQVKSSNHSLQNEEWELPQTHSIEKHFDYLKQSFNATLNLLKPPWHVVSEAHVLRTSMPRKKCTSGDLNLS